jgi:hypothetical protein
LSPKVCHARSRSGPGSARRSCRRSRSGLLQAEEDRLAGREVLHRPGPARQPEVDLIDVAAVDRLDR